MIYTLVLEMRRVPGAVIRAIGLVERRQFMLCSVSAGARTTDGQLQMVMQVDGDGRSPRTLVRQLEKQFDVESVACWPEPARQEARAPAVPEHVPAAAPGRPDFTQPLPATVPA